MLVLYALVVAVERKRGAALFAGASLHSASSLERT